MNPTTAAIDYWLDVVLYALMACAIVGFTAGVLWKLVREFWQD